jgi:hypothetical protein
VDRLSHLICCRTDARDTFSTIKHLAGDAKRPRFQSGNNPENWTNFFARVLLGPSQMNGLEELF